MEGNESIVNQIAQSLAFEVEAVPRDDILKLSNSSKTTPLNLKIRVRKKKEATVKQGYLSVPKLGQPGSPPERIRLISSDQTILSFNVFMETEIEKKHLGKSRKRIFGGCLGTEPDDDDDSSYMPYSSQIDKASKSEERLKQNFILQRNENNYNDISQLKRQKVFFGKCKPGGCLDPPFNEDKYSYKPKELAIISPLTPIESNKPQLNEVEKQASITSEIFKKKRQNKDKLPLTQQENEEIVTSSSSILSLYQTNCLKNSLSSKGSDSIITYPPVHESNTEKINIKNRISAEERLRKSFNEFSDIYFPPPKNISGRKGSNVENTTAKVVKQVYKRNSPQNEKTDSMTKEENSQIVKLRGTGLNILRTKTSTLSLDAVNRRNSDYKKTAQENIEDRDIDLECFLQKKTYDEKNDTKSILSHKDKELLKTTAGNYINAILPSAVNENTPLEMPNNGACDNEVDNRKSLQLYKYSLDKVASLMPPKDAEGSYIKESDIVIADHDQPQSMNMNLEKASNLIENKIKLKSQFPLHKDKSLSNTTLTPDDIYPNSIENLNLKNSDIMATKYTTNEPLIVESMNIKDVDSIEIKENLKYYPPTLKKKDASVTKIKQDNIYLEANEKYDDANLDVTVKTDFNKLQRNIEMEKTVVDSNFRENSIIMKPDIEATEKSRVFDTENKLNDTTFEHDSREHHDGTFLEKQKQEEMDSISHDNFIQSSTNEMFHRMLQDQSNKTEDSLIEFDISKQSHEVTLTNTLNILRENQPKKNILKETMPEIINNDTASGEIQERHKDKLLPSSYIDLQQKNVPTDKYLIEDNLRDITPENSIYKMPMNKSTSLSTYSTNNQDTASSNRYNKVVDDLIGDNSIGENSNNSHKNYNFTVDRMKVDSSPFDSNSESRIDLYDNEQFANLGNNELENGLYGEKHDTVMDENSIVINKTKIDDNDSALNKAIPKFDLADYKTDTTVINEYENNGKNGHSSKLQSKEKIVARSLRGSSTVSPVPLEESQKPNTFKKTDGMYFPPTGVIPLRQSIARLSIKSDKEYNKGSLKDIDASLVDHGAVFVDLAFQSYIHNEKHRVLKTFDPMKDTQRGPKDNIMLIKTHIKPNSTDIRIPMDSRSFMSISIKTEDNPQAALALKKIDSPSISFGRQGDNKDQIKHTKTDMDVLQNTLLLIYEQQLLPLQSVIKDLREQVELLESQQFWLKDHLSKTRRPKPLRMSNSNKRCGCHRKINLF